MNFAQIFQKQSFQRYFFQYLKKPKMTKSANSFKKQNWADHSLSVTYMSQAFSEMHRQSRKFLNFSHSFSSNQKFVKIQKGL